MEFVAGHRPAPADELEARGLDPQALLQAGARAMLEQVFEHGLFHADPHPGNLLLLPGNRICFLDFGLFGRLGIRERRRMAFVFWALVEGDYEAVGEQLLRVATLRPSADPAGFRAAAADLVEEWFGRPAGEFSIARLLLGQLALGAHHGIVFPRELMLLARALVNLEATATTIDPTLTLEQLTRPLLPELRQTLLLDPRALEQAWRRNRFDYLELALELPEALPELVARLRTGPRPLQPSPANPPARASLLAPLSAAFAAGASTALALAARRQTHDGRVRSQH